MILLSLVLVHLLADFHFQTDDMVRDKLKNIRKHILHHSLLTAMVLCLFMIKERNGDIVWNFILPLLFIASTHFTIDLMKIKLIDSVKAVNNENLKQLRFFVLDQLLHFIFILLTCHLFFGLNLNRTARSFVELLSTTGADLSHINQILFITIILILATSVSGHFIRILLGSLPGQLLTFEGKYSFKNERKDSQKQMNPLGESGLTEEYNFMIFNKHDFSRGKMIGYLERLLVILLTFYSAYPAIGFIVTAKSIARFKQLDDRDWAEYFLLGTLSSMFIGISLGILLREVLV